MAEESTKYNTITGDTEGLSIKPKLLELSICQTDLKQDQSEAISLWRNQFQSGKEMHLTEIII